MAQTVIAAADELGQAATAAASNGCLSEDARQKLEEATTKFHDTIRHETRRKFDEAKTKADAAARELLLSEQAERDRTKTKKDKKRLKKKNQKLDKECLVCMAPTSVKNPFVQLGTCDHMCVCKACAAEISARSSVAVCPICNV